MLRHVVGAQQAPLFTGEYHKEDGALGPLRVGSEGPGQFDNTHRTRPVVVGAMPYHRAVRARWNWPAVIVNSSGLLIGARLIYGWTRGSAVVIVVRGDHHCFRAERGIQSLQQTGDIPGSARALRSIDKVNRHRVLGQSASLRSETR